ncbi:aminopeptidase, partial [Bacillus cereus]|nr:aminopeptidase [Bacillus cereus]
FTKFPEWEVAKRNTFLDARAAFIAIVSPNPDLLKGIDPQRIGSFQKASGQALEKYRQYVQSDKVSWTVVAAATKNWAAKIFPDVTPDEA